MWFFSFLPLIYWHYTLIIQPLTTLPKVCPRRIELQMDVRHSYVGHKEELIPMLQELFMFSGTTESITLSDSVFGEMVEALTGCLEDGTIPSTQRGHYSLRGWRQHLI
jgi:hypothetical protein